MPQNGIRMEGIEAIVTGLRANEALETLDLQDNTATERGSKAIAESLPSCVHSSSPRRVPWALPADADATPAPTHTSSWPKLRHLNLSDCLLRPRGGHAIFTALLSGSSPNLSTLKLQSNELDARAVLQLARALDAHGEHVVELELNGNYGEDGTEEQFEKVREALDKWGHGEALDELDELEEPEEEEEEEEEEETEEERAEEEEPKEPATAQDKKDEDELAGLLGKVEIK